MNATLRLLGMPELEAGGQVVRLGAERRYQLLALLAVNAGQWLPRDTLAALLWPEHTQTAARRNLRKVVFDSRAVPGTQALEVADDALRWPVASDLQAFEQAVRERRHGDVVALGGLPLLQGVDDPANAAFSDWLARQRMHVDDAWQQAAHEQLQQQPQGLDATARLALAQALLSHDPLDESALIALMQAALAQGERALALRSYQAYTQRLASDLGLEPSNALRAFWRGDALPPVAVAALPPGPDFIGRRSELAELVTLLERPDCRLLTLLGPGGIGKSRLAQQALQRCASHFPAGCLWIELQDLHDIHGVSARLAQRLGLQTDDARETLPQLAAALPPQRLLLALDNAEHLAQLPAWVGALLAAAPALTVLVTSRERLHCAGEWLRPLAGLALPDEDSRDLEAARSFDAVRLFEARAGAARPEFDLAAQWPAALEIVDTVGGMPLAIELAASWVRLLPPAEIARELRQSLDLLQADPQRSGPAARPEHRSVAAMLEGTWARLSLRERQALAAVSVFEGGFTRAAAQAVAGVSLPLLAALVDRSLLQVDENGRFGMHPLALAWARDKRSAATDEDAAWRRAHALHFARWLQSLAPLGRSRPGLLVAQMRAEQANWTLAWQRALQAAPGAPAAVLRDMLPAVQAFFETQGRWSEGLALFRPLLALPGDDPEARLTRALAQAALASLLYRRGDLREAEVTARAALLQARAAGSRTAEINALIALGLTLWNQGRSAEALPQLEQLLLLARAEGDVGSIGRALNTLALVEKALGRYPASLQRQQEVLALRRAQDDRVGLATALNNIGNLHRAMAQYRAALPCFEEALQLCDSEGLVSIRSFALLNLGLTLFELGEPARAATLFAQTLVQVRQAGQAQVEVSALMSLARCDVRAAQFAAALSRLREALALARAKGFDAHVPDILGVYAECCAASGQAARAAELWCWLSRQDACDELVRAEARARLEALGPDVAALAAAQAQAEGLDTEAICAWLDEA